MLHSNGDYDLMILTRGTQNVTTSLWYTTGEDSRKNKKQVPSIPSHRIPPACTSPSAIPCNQSQFHVSRICCIPCSISCMDRILSCTTSYLSTLHYPSPIYVTRTTPRFQHSGPNCSYSNMNFMVLAYFGESKMEMHNLTSYSP
jgi:hypothetical protein